MDGLACTTLKSNQRLTKLGPCYVVNRIGVKNVTLGLFLCGEWECSFYKSVKNVLKFPKVQIWDDLVSLCRWVLNWFSPVCGPGAVKLDLQWLQKRGFYSVSFIIIKKNLFVFPLCFSARVAGLNISASTSAFRHCLHSKKIQHKTWLWKVIFRGRQKKWANETWTTYSHFQLPFLCLYIYEYI